MLRFFQEGSRKWRGAENLERVSLLRSQLHLVLVVGSAVISVTWSILMVQG